MKIGNLEIKRAQPEQKPTPPPVSGEMAILFSRLYSKLERYNPDGLIGRRGWDIYRKMLTDDQVKAVQTFFKHASLARGFTWVVDEDSPQADLQREFAAWAEAMARAMRGTFTDKLFAMQSAHDYGFAMLEKVYEPWQWKGKTWWAVVDLKLKPFSSFSFKGDEFGNIDQVRQEISGDEVGIDLSKFIHYVNRPDIDPHYGESDLKDIYRAWWSKDVVIKLMNLYLERMAGGFAAAEIQPEAQLSAEQRTNLENVLSNLQGGTGIIFPPGVTGKFVFPSSTDAYEKAIALYDKAMSKGLLMPNLLGLSEQGQTGSYSQSTNQLEVFFFVLDARSARLADAVTEQMWAPLAEWNFGLTDLPAWVPSRYTASQKLELAKTWGQLAQQKVVIPDTGSEDHLRDLLAFPLRPAGAKAITAGTAPAVQPSGPLQGPDPRAGGAPSEPKPKAKADEGADDGSGGQEAADEEADPQQTRAYANSPPWVMRCDFAAVDKATREAEDRLTDGLGEVMLRIGDWLTSQVKQGKLGTPQGSADGITKLAIPGPMLTALRKELRRGLEAAWNLGQRQAGQELKRAGWKSSLAFAIKGSGETPGPGLDQDRAEDFLRARSYFGVQNLQSDLLKDVQSTLFIGLKYDFTTEQIAAKLGEILGQYIPEVDAAGRKVNVPARLQTIARTNTFEAVNESRLNFFRSPDLEGFVQALEYNAILDSRTTELCQGLHGHVAPIGDPVWDDFRPPNHFNCRSVLLPITENDAWQPAELDPREKGLKPAPGFEGRGPQERMGGKAVMQGKTAVKKAVKQENKPPEKAWMPRSTVEQIQKQAGELFPKTHFDFTGLGQDSVAALNQTMQGLIRMVNRCPVLADAFEYVGTYGDDLGKQLFAMLSKPDGSPYTWDEALAHAWNKGEKTVFQTPTGAIAADWSKGRAVIGLNPGVYADSGALAAIKNNCYKMGFHAGDGISSIIVHEIGHCFNHLTQHALYPGNGFRSLGIAKQVKLKSLGVVWDWDGRVDVLDLFFKRTVLQRLNQARWEASEFGGEDILKAFLTGKGQTPQSSATMLKLSEYGLFNEREAFAEAFEAYMDIGMPGGKFASLAEAPEIVQRMGKWVEFWNARPVEFGQATERLMKGDAGATELLQAIQGMIDEAGGKGLIKVEAY